MPEILVTGGTGKTGRRVAERLRALGPAPRVATRRPARPGEVRFDWSDAATFDGAFGGICAVYLVAPAGVADPLAAMLPGLEHAMAANVRRFVLLSASSLEEGGPMMGAVHRRLREHAPEWVVLRPTWFMQNLSEQQHLPTIRIERAIYSATGDGRVAFIDAEDIAATAAVALTDPGMANGDLVLTGPEPLSYDDVARILSDAVGESVVHRRLGEAGMAERYRAAGMPGDYAATLAAMDTAIKAGSEDRVTETVERLTGSKPRTLQRFAAEHRACWLSR